MDALDEEANDGELYEIEDKETSKKFVFYIAPLGLSYYPAFYFLEKGILLYFEEKAILNLALFENYNIENEKLLAKYSFPNFEVYVVIAVDRVNHEKGEYFIIKEKDGEELIKYKPIDDVFKQLFRHLKADAYTKIIKDISLTDLDKLLHRLQERYNGELLRLTSEELSELKRKLRDKGYKRMKLYHIDLFYPPSWEGEIYIVFPAKKEVFKINAHLNSIKKELIKTRFNIKKLNL